MRQEYTLLYMYTYINGINMFSIFKNGHRVVFVHGLEVLVWTNQINCQYCCILKKTHGEGLTGTLCSRHHLTTSLMDPTAFLGNTHPVLASDWLTLLLLPTQPPKATNQRQSKAVGSIITYLPQKQK